MDTRSKIPKAPLSALLQISCSVLSAYCKTYKLVMPFLLCLSFASCVERREISEISGPFKPFNQNERCIDQSCNFLHICDAFVRYDAKKLILNLNIPFMASVTTKISFVLLCA